MRLLLTLSVVAASAVPAFAGDVDLPRHPSLSPDGREVAFSWRGDLWKAPGTGGQAVRLTAHQATETRSAWSPDGRSIAFQSDRSGADNVWVMDADGGGVRAVTKDDTGLALSQWSADGREILFEARREADFFRDVRPYAVSVTGGPPRRLHDAFGRESAQSADGKRLLFTRGGSAWSRRGYRGADSRDVWLHDTAAKSFKRLTQRPGNDGRAAWIDDRTIVYLSDRSDATVDVWRRAIDAPEDSAVRVAAFDGRDVWDLAVSRDGRTAVVVVWDALWRIDLSKTNAAPERIRITAPEDAGDAEETLDVSDDVTEAALSPDGKVLATIAYGDVFVRNVEEKYPTQRVTRTAARERYLAWSPDGLKLWFSADPGGNESIFSATVASTRGELRTAFDTATKPPGEKKVEPPPEAEKPKEPAADEKKDEDKDDEDKPKKPAKKTPADRWQDAVTFSVETVVDAPTQDRNPRPSPDGKRLAFRRGLGDVVLLDLATKKEQVLLCCWDFEVELRWSPDSNWIAYSRDDPNFNSDVWVVRTDGQSPPVNISRHPANDVAPRWSADGKILAFLSQRSGREFDVWRVHLDPALDVMSPAETAEYYKETAKAAKARKPLAIADPKKPAKPDAPKPEVTLELEDAWKRLTRITTLRGDESALEISPAGDLFVFKGKDGTEDALFSIGWDGKNQKRLTGPGDLQGVSLTGENVVYVAGGRAGTVPAAGGAAKNIETEAKIRIDRTALSEQKFREAARVVGEHFYHPTMKGLDWPALTEKYLALARRARTNEEFEAIAQYLLGELNGSHLGVAAKRRERGSVEANGRIGVDVEPAPGAFRVKSVLPYGPADRGAMKLAAGDVITSVEGVPFAANDAFDPAFFSRAGKETLLGVRREKDGKTLELQALVTPCDWGAEQRLRYDAAMRRNADRVHALSKERLGYLHIRSMDQASLEDFERDLYAAAEGREGLVIDVRNNGGGHTADLVLASLMVQPHAYTVPRGGDPAIHTGYPHDRLFIQRYVLPCDMLCNEKSFSNAEIVSHAFQTLRRGTLVGQATYGGVISTGSATLVDGTTVRVPFRGWYLADGTDMENHPAVPDLLVPQTPEAESRDEDEQLAAAVGDLLKRLPAK